MKIVDKFRVPTKKNPVGSLSSVVPVGDFGRNGHLCRSNVPGFGVYCPQSLSGNANERRAVESYFTNAITN